MLFGESAFDSREREAKSCLGERMILRHSVAMPEV
jgi:hypothetical protein